MTTTKQYAVSLSVWVLAVAVLFALGATQAVAQETEMGGQQQATLQVNEHPELGEHLVDAEGMSLYLFESDSEGNSTCYDACAEAWPPYTLEGGPEPGEGVDTDLLSTMEREDGTTQVTYNGWPLYYFVQDAEPGDIQGQDIEGFGAEWYLISPEGEKVEGETTAE